MDIEAKFDEALARIRALESMVLSHIAATDAVTDDVAQTTVEIAEIQAKAARQDGHIRTAFALEDMIAAIRTARDLGAPG